MNKRRISPHIIRLPQKSKPPKLLENCFPASQAANHAVKIGGVVEGAALGKNGQRGKALISLGEMMKPGVGFPSNVRERNRAGPGFRRGRGLVVNCQVGASREIPSPAEILPATANDHLKHRNLSAFTPRRL